MKVLVPATILALTVGLTACNQSAAPAADTPAVVVAPVVEGPPGPAGAPGAPGADAAPSTTTTTVTPPSGGSSTVTVEKK